MPKKRFSAEQIVVVLRHQAAICSGRPEPRRCSAPSSGAVSAWVSGPFTRAGPMTATVCNIAAALAP